MLRCRLLALGVVALGVLTVAHPPAVRAQAAAPQFASFSLLARGTGLDSLYEVPGLLPVDRFVES